jgi:hypothetical protein
VGKVDILGILIESQGPSWLYGTASEHAVLYQYQLYNAKDIFMGMVRPIVLALQGFSTNGCTDPN